MNVRVVLCSVAVAAAATACSSSGTAGHLQNLTSGGATTSSSPTGTSSGGQSAPASSGGGSSVSSSVSSGGGSGPAGFCAKLKDAESKLSSVGESATDPDQFKTAIAEEISAFQSLKDGAPANVAPAIDDLIKVLTAAQAVFKDPTHADPSALQSLASKLPQDSETIASYVGTNCA